MEKIGRVCVGGPLDGEIVEHEANKESFTRDGLPSKQWPGNAHGASIRRDTYVEDGPHWRWVPTRIT